MTLSKPNCPPKTLLQIPLHSGLGLQHTNFEDTNIQWIREIILQWTVLFVQLYQCRIKLPPIFSQYLPITMIKDLIFFFINIILLGSEIEFIVQGLTFAILSLYTFKVSCWNVHTILYHGTREFCFKFCIFRRLMSPESHNNRNWDQNPSF